MPVSSVSRELALVIERVEAEARRDHYASATPEDRAALGIRTRELDGALVLAVDRDESLLMNRVLGLGLATPVTDRALDQLLAHYTARAAELGPPTGFAINLCPFAAPAGIEQSLERRGFRTFFHHLKWVREDSPAPKARTEGLLVEEVGFVEVDSVDRDAGHQASTWPTSSASVSVRSISANPARTRSSQPAALSP